MQRVAAAAAAETSQAPAETAAGRLGARLLDRYDDKTWKMHQEYLRLSTGDGRGDRPPQSSPAAAPAYLPDEHQPLLVEMMMDKAVDGTPTGAESSEKGSADSQEPAPTGGRRSWIAWPGAHPPSTSVESASVTTTEFAGGGQTGDAGGGGGRGAGGSIKEGASALPSVQASGPEPQALPPALPSPPSHGSVVEAAGEKQEENRPDRRMMDVYEALAERVRLLVRERRRAAAAAAATTPEAGQAVGAGAVGVAGGSAVGRQQLWVAVAGAPGSGKTTLAVRRFPTRADGVLFSPLVVCCRLSLELHDLQPLPDYVL